MTWNIDPVLIHLGPLEIRYYGLLFATGLFVAATTAGKLFDLRGLSKDDLNRLVIWIVVGVILGAHLVHLIFYEPRAFIEDPIRIIQIGSGLASHGGGLGAILVLYIWCRRKKVSFYQYGDPMMVAAMWVVPAVRLGNFFNSEIYGRETTVPWGVIFARHGFTTPRHPSQLYEAAVGLLIVVFMLWFYRRNHHRLQPGATFYLTLFLYFTTRFFIEYFKEYQALPPSFPFTMGQCLSAPIALLALYMITLNKKTTLWAKADNPPATQAQQASPKKKSQRPRTR